MALKFKYKSEADIPADQKALYKKQGDVWILDAEGAEDAERFAEFRDTNISLLKALGANSVDDAKAKAAAMKDVDPARYKQLVADAEAAEQKRLKDAGKLEELHAQQVAALKKAHTEELTRLGSEKAGLQARLENLLIDGAVQTEALKKGVRSTALPDVVARARNIFKLDGDKVTAKNGDKALFNSKGEPLAIGDWLDSLTADAPHLFEGSKGGGSGGGAGGGNFGGLNYNPFDPKTPNRTEQARIARTNPELAARLRTLAGTNGKAG
jgi:hypothetical protein